MINLDDLAFCVAEGWAASCRSRARTPQQAPRRRGSPL